MNLIGHPYIGFKAIRNLNGYLLAGSYLPDMVPFFPQSPFSFEEIHEGGDKFLVFLDQNYRQYRDLALGMMAHSVKYGADRFNCEIEAWLIGNDGELKNYLAQEITKSLKTNLNFIKGNLMHNYLWSGIDVYLLKNNFGFVKHLSDVRRQIDEKTIVRLLSEFFKKDNQVVKESVSQFFNLIKPDSYLSIRGLGEFWRRFLLGLKEIEEVDVDQTINLFEKIYLLFENRWAKILEKIEHQVVKSMRPFILRA